MHVPLAALDLDDSTLTASGRQPVHQMTVVGDHHERRLGRCQPLFEPLDGFEIEVIGRFVEHDHVELANQRARQGDTLGLPARQLVRSALEQWLYAQRGRHGGDLPRVAEILGNGSGR